MGAPLGPAECVVHLGRSYPHEDPSCSGPVPTAKTTLNPAHVRPERRALQNEPRLDDTITWRALPAEFGNWNSVWKRFWRLSQAGVQAGVFEAFFDALAAMSQTAHLVQIFDATVVRAHVSAAGAKGGRTV